MTSNLDYKKYSLDKLKEWVHDALSCGEASPHEIYSAIREAVQEDYQYYKDHSNRALGLLELMSGHRPVAEKDDGMRPWGHSDLEYQIANHNNVSSCDKDDPSPYCKSSWNDFWEENYYPEEYKGSTVSNVDLKKEIEKIREEGGYDWTPPTKSEKSEHYYDYTRNDPNRKNPFEKKKWVLPVEQFAGSDEYLISFPDDLLEAANLKEGDEVEWIDQGDGSALLKKVIKPMTYDEMIAAGWTMTADGFWIKE
jgi:hypothetical protein